MFTRDPEQAHELTLEMLSKFSASGRFASSGGSPFTHAALRVDVAGLTFPNPVGLAAGCDKNASAVNVWPHFGFGFVEVGTITAQPQPGNPRPRVFRLAQHRAIINQLGFNSEGSDVVARRLHRLRERSKRLASPLGINIGKTKTVSGDDAILEDYRTSFGRLAPYADYITINVSSPNTPGLRQLQERGPLTALLSAMMDEANTKKVPSATSTAAAASTTPLPVFVKISPDLDNAAIAEVVEVALKQGLAGIIATNTTIARPDVIESEPRSGGLSGRPLRNRANEVMKFLYRETGGKLPLIGVGGIDSADAAYERICSGASLIQLYTGMIYEGPYLARRINKGLLALMKRDGIANISEAVGSAADETAPRRNIR